MSGNCCDLGFYDEIFSVKRAAREIRSFNKKGAKKTSRKLISSINKQLQKEEEMSSTLLDIGSGVGSIPRSLEMPNLKKIISVDISKAYQEALKKEIRASINTYEFYLGDFVDMSDKIQPTDIVTLDKVICCYEHYQPLVKYSVSKSLKYYGIVVTKNAWWVEFGNGLGKLFRKIAGIRFETFIHPVKNIEAIIFEEGFERIQLQNYFNWQILLYKKKAVINI